MQAQTAIDQEQIARALVAVAAHKAVKPKEQLTVSEWADANRRLVEGADPEAGKFRTSRNPPMREIQDQLSEHAPARRVAFKGPTQFAKTLIATNWLGYVIAHAKGSMGIFMPTGDSLGDWNEQKFEPMAEHTESVKKALTSRHSGTNSTRRKRYVGGTLYFRSAGSTADMRNLTLRYINADEIDEYKADTGQGDPLGLIANRLSAHDDSKLYLSSSPTLTDNSLIEIEFEGGDQRYYHVTCPHCGESQVFKWPNLRWRKAPGRHNVIVDVFYACEHNGCVILEHEKTAMIDGGRWVAENPGAPYPSYTINALYTPEGLGLTWTELAQEWLDAQGDRAKLMRFVNSRLAETYTDRSSDIKPTMIAERAEPYSLRTVPAGCLLITVGVDVQSGADARLELQVLGHGYPKKTWTLDYHVIPGNPEGSEVWDALTEYVNNIAWTNSAGNILRSEACAIDTGGHHTHDVYNYVRAKRVRRPMATKGASAKGQVILGKPRPQDVNFRGRSIKNGVKLFFIGSDTAKFLLYGRLHDDADKPANKRMVHFSHDLPLAFYDGLLAETYNPRKNAWERKRGKRNEPLDTWYLALAAAHHPELYMHKWRKTDWERRAAMLEPAALDDVDEAPATQAPAVSDGRIGLGNSKRFGR